MLVVRRFLIDSNIFIPKTNNLKLVAQQTMPIYAFAYFFQLRQHTTLITILQRQITKLVAQHLDINYYIVSTALKS